MIVTLAIRQSQTGHCRSVVSFVISRNENRVTALVRNLLEPLAERILTFLELFDVRLEIVTHALDAREGSLACEDEFKIRGIEARQHSTPLFIEDVQRSSLERFNAIRSPEAAIGRIGQATDQLHITEVDTNRLVECTRVSKTVNTYTQYT